MSSRSRTRDSRITWLTPRAASSRISRTGATAERARRMTADPDGDRSLRGLRRHAEPLELHELAAVAHALVAPAGLHDPDRLVAPGAAPLVGHAEELDLLLHPADTRAQDDAAGRQVIERREHLGGEDGMTVGENEHGRAEANAFGDGGDEPEGDQRLQEGG